MPLAIRHLDDPSPKPLPLAGLTIRRETDAALMAALQGKPETEMTRRFAAGHRAYVAWLLGEPAAWGWVATRVAEIGEIGRSFSIPNGERYLWNFVTLPAQRGKGIYPRLLDAIVEAESHEASRFWIAWAPENHASGAGIGKVGFVALADLSFDRAGSPALRGTRDGGAALASALLQLPESADELAPCWRCARSAMPEPSGCSAGACACDYQRPVEGCQLAR